MSKKGSCGIPRGAGILESAADWDLRVDLRKQVVSWGDYHLDYQTRHSAVVQSNKTSGASWAVCVMGGEDACPQAPAGGIVDIELASGSGLPRAVTWRALSRLWFRSPSRRRLVANITNLDETASRWLKSCKHWNNPSDQVVNQMEQWLWDQSCRGSCPRVRGAALKPSGGVVG